MSTMPANLNNLDTASPLPGQSYADLVEEFRALKALLKGVLLVSMAPDGSLKAVSNGSIGTDAVDSNAIQSLALLERHFSDDSIPTRAFKNNSVPGVALLDGSVTQNKYGNGSIPTSAFQNETIPLAALAVKVSSTYLANHGSDDSLRAVGQNHLKDGAVTNRAVADMAFNKLTGGADGSFLFKVSGVWEAVVPTGGLTYDPGSGEFLLNSPVAVAVLEDQKSRGVNGGTPTGGVWTTRDIGEISDEADFVTLIGNVFTLLEGQYHIRVRVPGYGVGPHQARLLQTLGGTNTVPLWGSSAACAASNTTESIIDGYLDVADDETQFKIEHFCTTGTTNGFGIAVSSENTNPVGAPFSNHVEVYTSAVITRLSSPA